MGTLEVLFEVPKYIELGLRTGQFERVGGVIVEAGSKQVVAWLRDGGLTQVNQVLSSVSGLNPLSAVLNLASTGLQLYDGHLTREAVYELSDHVASMTRQVASMTTLLGTGQIINLALAGVSFRETMKRLDRLTDQLNHLEKVIREEFEFDREINFQGALQAALDAFETNNPTHKLKAAHQAKDELYKARENFLTKFKNLLGDDMDDTQIIRAQQYLIRAMYASINWIRCFIELDDIELAKQRLQEDLPKFQEYTQTLVGAWLGKSPAIYFHTEVEPEDLDRFIQISYWMQGVNRFDASASPKALFALIDQLRGDFWDAELLRPDYDAQFFDRVRRLNRPVRTFPEKMQLMVENLQNAEMLIENYRRMEGFDIELRSVRLSSGRSFARWSNVVSSEELEEHGAAILMDKDMIERLSVEV